MEIVGEKLAKEMEHRALALYTKARDVAADKGILIADTKFEFGVNDKGDLILVDEVLTPGNFCTGVTSWRLTCFFLDSSRFWPADKYVKGQSQPSFDKQYLRDFLTSIQFDKKAGIELPKEVVEKTLEKYVEAFTILTGHAPVLWR